MSSSYNVADLAVVNYEKVLEHDVEACQTLLEACREWGFFYLDLGCHDEIKKYYNLIQGLLEFSKQYFAKSIDQKLTDTNRDFATFNVCGYKPMALDTGNMQSKKDGCEGLRIPSDLCNDITENSNLSIPPGARESWTTVRAFNNQSHSIAINLLSSLSVSLGLSGSQRFEEYHQVDRSSTTTSVLQHYPHRDGLDEGISVGHFAHTDTGSVTILFNTEWGLQVHSPDSETWKWIPPHPHYAIVNIGDTLKFLSNKVLKSALHRVVPADQSWRSGSRYAIIFFLRANNSAEFEDLEGKRWKAIDWLMRKFGGYRETHSVQEKNPVSTGKIGFVGLWEDHPSGMPRRSELADTGMMDKDSWQNLMWSSLSS